MSLPVTPNIVSASAPPLIKSLPPSALMVSLPPPALIVSSSLAGSAIGAIENLTLTGTAAINGTGNALANVITGNSGNNVGAWWRGQSGRWWRDGYGDVAPRGQHDRLTSNGMRRINHISGICAGDGDAGNVADVEGIGRADSVGCATRGRVIDRHRHRITRLALEIEHRASLEIEGVADDLEGCRIRPGQRQGVAPECIVGDIDVSHLDVARR